MSASRRVPEWLTKPLPSTVTRIGGRGWVCFTPKVNLLVGGSEFANPIFPHQEHLFVDTSRSAALHAAD